MGDHLSLISYPKNRGFLIQPVFQKWHLLQEGAICYTVCMNYDNGEFIKEHIWSELCSEQSVQLEPASIAYLESIAVLPQVQRAIAEGEEELQLKIQFWKEQMARFNVGSERTNVMDLILAHPDFLKQFERIERSFFDIRWLEYIRTATELEQAFCRQARRIGKGKFTEILQMSAFTEQGVIKEVALSGGLEVSQQVTDAIIQKVIQSKQVLRVDLAHNHPDEYGGVSVAKDSELGNGFVTNGALSSRDITLADSLYEQLGKSIPVNIIAVNERGLTYGYKGGTSVKIK